MIPLTIFVFSPENKLKRQPFVDGPPSTSSVFTDGQLLAGVQEQVCFVLLVYPCGNESVR